MTVMASDIETGVFGLEHFDVPGRSAAEARNAATAREIFLAFARAEFEVLGEYLAADAVTVIVGLDLKKLGAHAVDFDFFRRTFPHGLRFQIRSVLVDRDRVCIQWDDEAVTDRGHHYVNSGVHIFQFNPEGRIQDSHEYLDPDRFMEIL